MTKFFKGIISHVNTDILWQLQLFAFCHKTVDCNCQGSWIGKIPWRRDRLPTPVFLGFPCGSAGKESACKAGDLGSISGLGRFPGEGKGYPPQYSGLGNSMDCVVDGVAKSRTGLSDFTNTLTAVRLLKVHRISSVAQC